MAGMACPPASDDMFAQEGGHVDNLICVDE